MKVTLEFTLPEEKEGHHDAIHGGAYHGALQELDNWLRHKFKYENQADVNIYAVRKKIDELLGDLSLW